MNKLLFLLCLTKATQIVQRSKSLYPGCESAVNKCGDPPSTQESSAEMLNALRQFAPGAIEALSKSALPVGQNLLDASRQLAPQQAQLESDLYRDYGPGVAATDDRIRAAQNMAASQSELALARGPGQDLVRQAVDMQKLVDPGAEQTRDLVSAGIEKYLAAQNGGMMNASEIEQVNRGISQREGAGMAPSALQTLNNARTFGDAGTAKWNQFGQALSTASSMIPQLRSGISGFEVATRRQVGQDPTARLTNPAAVSAVGVGAENMGFANNALNQIGASQRTSIAKKESTMDKILKGGQAIGSVYSYSGG